MDIEEKKTYEDGVRIEEIWFDDTLSGELPDHLKFRRFSIIIERADVFDPSKHYLFDWEDFNSCGHS